MSADPILPLLRKRTAKAHEAVHELPIMQRLLSHNCTLTDYQRVLTSFYRFHLSYQGAFDSLADHHRFNQQAPALQWLVHDLKALDVAISKENQPVKHSQNGHDAMELERYLAFMYVTQGSTLGGQLILKRLQENIAEQTLAGASKFYGGYGASTAQVWKSFLTYLDEKGEYADREKVADFAEQCFQQITEELGYD